MPDTTLRDDILACVFNYFYDGWKYRIEAGEAYEYVAKDCKEAAENLVSRYEAQLQASNNTEGEQHDR